MNLFYYESKSNIKKFFFGGGGGGGGGLGEGARVNEFFLTKKPNRK